MGLFDTLFGGKSRSSDDFEKYAESYKELIRFIRFAKKIKPLADVIFSMYVEYRAPEPNKGVYTSRVSASLNFCDFNEITFAREAALSSSEVMRKLVPLYYRDISKAAGLSQNDWPFGIDEYDFERVLCGTFGTSEELFVELIPDEHFDDVFTFKVWGGVDSRNALQVYNTANNLLKSNFPELQITKNIATPYYMRMSIQI